jgi:hypothetical protein
MSAELRKVFIYLVLIIIGGLIITNYLNLSCQQGINKQDILNQIESKLVKSESRVKEIRQQSDSLLQAALLKMDSLNIINNYYRTVIQNEKETLYTYSNQKLSDSLIYWIDARWLKFESTEPNPDYQR